jgi:hypothetical protein
MYTERFKSTLSGARLGRYFLKGETFLCQCLKRKGILNLLRPGLQFVQMKCRNLGIFALLTTPTKEIVIFGQNLAIYLLRLPHRVARWFVFKFWRALKWKTFLYFMIIWDSLWPFGSMHGSLV